MAFRDILVHVDNSPASAARIALAVGIAQRHKAHLTGLYVIPHHHYQPEHGDAEFISEEAAAIFELETTGSGITAEWRCVDWHVSGVDTAEIVSLYAYHTDLVIVGQGNPCARGEGTPADLAERLVATSGRPVLVVPCAGSFSSVGERVIVAWKSGRESVRAVNDAMPFLRIARQVGIVVVNPADDGADTGTDTSAEICTHLARHDIRAKVEHFVAADVPVGDLLLNQAWEEGCDLLVMGAYTHTAWGALTMGSVARHILTHTNIPVLLSH